MKRLRSSEDLDSGKDLSNPARGSRSSSYYVKPDGGQRKSGGGGFSPSSGGRYDRDRSGDEDGPRPVRKRPENDFDGADRRKGLDFDSKYGGGGRQGHSGNSRGGGGGSMNRSGGGREFPKGFRSERDRSRREGSVSSWRRFGGGKEFEERIGSGGGSKDSSWGSSPKGGFKRDDRKSPTWSRDSGSEQSKSVEVGKKSGQLRVVVVSRGGGSGRDEGKVKSSNSKSRSSPSWSKDSEGEQSKSIEVGKKNVELEAKSVETTEAKGVEMEVKSLEVEGKSAEDVEGKSAEEVEVKNNAASGSASEMEEGELEQDRDQDPNPQIIGAVAEVNENDNGKERRMSVEVDVDRREGGGENQTAEVEPQKADGFGREGDKREVNETPKCEEDMNVGVIVREDEEGHTVNEVKDGDGGLKRTKEESKTVIASPAEDVLDKGFDLDAKLEDPDSNKEVTEENGGTDLYLATTGLGQTSRDKGKSVAISLSHVSDSAQDCMWVEKESGNAATCRDPEDDMEGPSTRRGFELFSTSPVRRAEKVEQSGASKAKDERLTFEPLDLSLSLPNVLLPIGAARDSVQAPGSPSQGRSVHSFSTFRTNSDGFTASMSFSGSQSFFHNPSCSLTQNSLDMDNYEQSVHSRPIFQGLDQVNLPADSKQKDVPLYQKILANENGSLPQSQAHQGVPNGLERQVSFNKQLSSGQARNHDDTRSPAQSVGSHDIGSTYSFEKRAMREKHGASLYRSSSQKEQESLMIGGSEFVENIIGKIVSDPIHVMARKFNDMPPKSALILKDRIREIMNNADKQGQLCAFQSALQNRSDLALDTLLKSHRVQLEILVALKTGVKDYLQIENSISSSELAEVFLNLRCRNLSCRNLLPVDECDCKVCSKKTGFCSACMCLVCSKFDMASNTCSWIGCDVCLHWCHADCALRESFIRNGRGASGGHGPPEMQFHCVACDHPSEMFGFVKEVFQNFAKDWSAETFCKELEYVRRIFGASKDVRGRRLCDISDQLLAKLANKTNLPEVYSYVMAFLTDSDSSKFANASAFPTKEQGNASNGVVTGPSRETSWFKAVYAEKVPQSERSSSLLPSFHTDLNEKRPTESKPLKVVQKEPLFDELEGIVRIKQAEAEMFQSRADDARSESEGLRRIAIAKNEKIEEEYNSRIAKLRLVETEEMRKQKLDEFQALERAHREYFSMKMRMEADIKDLLHKMEATKRNLAA